MKRRISLLILIAILDPSLSHAAFRSGDGRKTVASAGTAEAIVASATSFTQADICAESDNTGQIAVGSTPIATLATREGIYLDAGDCYTISVPHGYGDLSEIKIDSTVSTDGVTFVYFREE